jgi:hypothetical protein
MTESGPCAGAMGAVQDEHHVACLCSPALSPYRLDFPMLFQNSRFGNVQNLFRQVDSARVEWSRLAFGVMLREMMSLFGGGWWGIQAAYMWVLCRISGRHGIELN